MTVDTARPKPALVLVLVLVLVLMDAPLGSDSG
jgi:hypothetical protein